MFKVNSSVFLQNNSEELCLDFQYLVESFNLPELPSSLSDQISHADIFNYIKNYLHEWYNLSDSHEIFFSDSESEIMTYLFSDHQKIELAQTDDWKLLTIPGAQAKVISTRPFEFVNAELMKTNTDYVFLNETSPLSGMKLENLTSLTSKFSKTQTIVIDGSTSFLNSELNLYDLGRNTLFIIEYLPKKYLLITQKKFGIQKNPPLSQAHLYLYEALKKLREIPKFEITQKLKRLQNTFLETLILLDHHYLCEKNILSVNNNNHGPIFNFVLPSIEHAKKTYHEVREKKIRINCVDNMLCFHLSPFLEVERLKNDLLKLRH